MGLGQHHLAVGFFLQQGGKGRGVGGLAAGGAVVNRLDCLLHFRQHHHAKVQPLPDVGDGAGILQHSRHKLAGGACGPQGSFAPAVIGHADIRRNPLAGKFVLLFAARPAPGPAHGAFQLDQHSLFINAGLLRNAPGIHIPRRGADRAACQNADGFIHILQALGIVAQVIFFHCLSQLELQRGCGAFQHGFKPVAAIGADKFIRVLGTGNVQHPHLQIGTGKQRQTALRCLLACFVRVIAQHHFVGVFRQQLDLLRRQSRAAGTDSGIKPGFVHRDDVHIPFAEDIPLGR